jgi:hypothetical protein
MNIDEAPQARQLEALNVDILETAFRSRPKATFRQYVGYLRRYARP